MWKIIASHSALKPALSTHYSALKLLRLNCVDFKDVCGPQGIDAYPTLRLYKAVLLGRYQLHWMPPLDSQFQISHILPKLGSPTWSWLCFCKHIGGLRQIIDSADSIIEFFWGGLWLNQSFFGGVLARKGSSLAGSGVVTLILLLILLLILESSSLPKLGCPSWSWLCFRVHILLPWHVVRKIIPCFFHILPSFPAFVHWFMTDLTDVLFSFESWAESTETWGGWHVLCLRWPQRGGTKASRFFFTKVSEKLQMWDVSMRQLWQIWSVIVWGWNPSLVRKDWEMWIWTKLEARDTSPPSPSHQDDKDEELWLGCASWGELPVRLNEAISTTISTST